MSRLTAQCRCLGRPPHADYLLSRRCRHGSPTATPTQRSTTPPGGSTSPWSSFAELEAHELVELGEKDGTGRRKPKVPVVEISRAKACDDALAGLERWKARHPKVVAHLEPADHLVDSMRGRSSTWTRIRVRLQSVPPELHPPQEPLDPDYDPWAEWRRS